MADWSGEFGEQYTARNMQVPDRRKFFQWILRNEIATAFEIGCNWGANLQELEAENIDAVGCDVNESAVLIANKMGLKAFHGEAKDINEKFDLVFTVGVLIHQQTPKLVEIMKHMVRLSSRYVMFAEYEGTDEEVPYRGERFALFKREFGKVFEALFPRAVLLERGFAGKELGFDDVTYWVYDISDCASTDGVSPVAGQSLDESAKCKFVGTFVTSVGAVGTD